MERPEQLATAGATVSTTTTTSSKQPVRQTTRAAEPTTSKDAINVVATEATEQEAAEQVVPEQSLPGTLSEGQVPENHQSVPKKTTTTMSSTQGGLPDATARGKSAATLSTTRLSQEQEQAGVE
jgi:hypothetical protein